jgi:hypothetical protein
MNSVEHVIPRDEGIEIMCSDLRFKLAFQFGQFLGVLGALTADSYITKKLHIWVE